MRHFVAEDGDIASLIDETVEKRHLDVVLGGGIVCGRTAMADERSGIGEETPGPPDAIKWIGEIDICLMMPVEPLDLVGVEDGVGLDEGNGAFDVIAFFDCLGADD